MTDYHFDQPEHLTVGAIGEVGARLFVLQARQGRQLVTVKVEKIQVSTLATYLARVVKAMGRPGHLPEVPALEFEAGLEIDFIVGDVNVALDEDQDRVVVLLEELVRDDDLEPSRLLCSLTKEQAGAFAIAATRLIEAGRPPCPLCALPLDPRGHDCPRTNGFRAPIT